MSTELDQKARPIIEAEDLRKLADNLLIIQNAIEDVRRRLYIEADEVDRAFNQTNLTSE